jgi:hypothetical protein
LNRCEVVKVLALFLRESNTLVQPAHSVRSATDARGATDFRQIHVKRLEKMVGLHTTLRAKMATFRTC